MDERNGREELSLQVDDVQGGQIGGRDQEHMRYSENKLQGGNERDADPPAPPPAEAAGREETEDIARADSGPSECRHVQPIWLGMILGWMILGWGWSFWFGLRLICSSLRHGGEEEGSLDDARELSDAGTQVHARQQARTRSLNGTFSSTTSLPVVACKSMEGERMRV